MHILFLKSNSIFKMRNGTYCVKKRYISDNLTLSVPVIPYGVIDFYVFFRHTETLIQERKCKVEN